MARDIDIYQIVRTFATRNNLSEIDYRTFVQALQRQARQADQDNPIFRDLALNPDAIVIPRLVKVANEKKLALEMVGNEIAKIVLPEHYAAVFLQEYRRMDESPEVPFPDEDSLKVIVPPDWIQAISLETDLGSVSEALDEKAVPLYRVLFSDGLRPLVIPTSFVPSKLIEYAVLKVRHYLRRGGNKEFIYNKLLYAFASKEQVLKETFSLILTRPYEAIEELRKSSSDFTFSFWAYLSSHLKKDLDKKSDKTSEDIAIYQASVICEFFANHYKGRAQRILDLETAFKSLAAALRKPPLHFSLDEILLFKDSKGAPLLGKYSREELESWLKDETTDANSGLLPELLIIATGKGRRSYIAKDKLPMLSLRLVGEARGEVRARLINEWKRALEEFRTLPAMEDDLAYRRELSGIIEERIPLLDALLKDRLLPLVYEELVTKNEAPAELERFFYRGDFVPLEDLLELPRKTMLGDARMLLPFWYSIPILAALARLFRRKPRKASPKVAKVEAIKVEKEASPPVSAAEDRKIEFARAAAQVAKTLVPSGLTIEDYLLELEARWNTILGREAKANLTEDVNSLVRDYLRGVLRTMRASTFTGERVKALAANLADTPSLLKIKNHSALELYIQVYMLRVLSR
ncbi:MAG: hypothetical protein WCL50_04085 [Spirochaetota bacterium]